VDELRIANRVKSCPRDHVSSMSGVPQIAVDLLQCQSRQPWANSRLSPCKMNSWNAAPPDVSDLAVALRDHCRTRPRELAAFRAAPWARAAIACSRNACTRRRRSEALAHTRPMRLAKEEASGTGSLASDKPSGHGGAQSGISDTPSPRSTMTAIASPPSISNNSRGRIPAWRR
jgi:hypothetical protein